jgi:hypothetical protein
MMEIQPLAIISHFADLAVVADNSPRKTAQGTTVQVTLGDRS